MNQIYLVSLTGPPETAIPNFLAALRFKNIKPVLKARVVRWIAPPAKLSQKSLLPEGVEWHLLLVFPAGTKLNTWVQWQIATQWSVTAGVPSQLLKDMPAKNKALLERSRRDAPMMKPKNETTGAASELASELNSWVAGLTQEVQTHPISMFNLLAFEPGKRDSYQQYAKEFGTRVGAKHGVSSHSTYPRNIVSKLTDPQGGAKLAGLTKSGQGKAEGWDEVAVAYYPSIQHFMAMIGSAEYKEINEKYRLGTLKDTCTMCTQEIDDNGELVGSTKAEQGRL